MTRIYPNAEKESTKLLEEISALFTCKPDEITITRLTQKAKKIIDVDVVGARTALGVLAAIKGNEVEAKRQFNLVLTVDSSSINNKNFAVVLSRLGLYKEAFDQANSAFNMEREDLSTLINLIDYACFAGLADELHKCLKLWEKQSPDKDYPSADILLEACNFLVEKNVDQASFERAVKLLFDVAEEFEVYSDTYRIIQPDDEELTFEIRVNTSPLDAVSLNEKFAERFLLDNKISDTVKNIFVGIYIPDQDASFA